MSTSCTVDDLGNIEAGDAVCLVGWDTTPNPHRPKVGRATRATLATSKTVFGVARAPANHGSGVDVFVAGEVVSTETDTGLPAGGGAGTSRIIVTDITQSDPDPAVAAALQCRLIRIDRPDGSEFVVGTCDEDGNLAVQPRASRDTSNLHVFNVRSYGALGDGATDDWAAITNAMSAIAPGGGRLFFPPGTYSVKSNFSIPEHVQAVFDEGAMLTPSSASVTILGPVTCHPSQHVFGGTGFNDSVAAKDKDGNLDPTLPTVTVSGSAFGNYSVLIDILTDGPLGTATFKYSLDGGTVFSNPALTITPSVSLPLIGLVIGFDPGTYRKHSKYSWMSSAPIIFGPAAFDRFSVRNFGAVPDYNPNTKIGTFNLKSFHAALAAMSASGNRSAKLLVDGHFYLEDTLALTQTVWIEGTGENEPPPFASSRSTPGTMLVFPKNVTGIRIHSADVEDNRHPEALRRLSSGI